MSCWNWTRREWVCNCAPAILCALIIAPVTWYVTDRQPPFEFERGFLTPGVAIAGQKVTVTWQVRNQSPNECDGTVRRIIVDEKGTQWTLAATDAVYARVRKGNTFSVNFTLPEFMANGKAIYYSYPEYWCNWAQRLRPVPGDAPPIEFIVMNPR